jgi:fermentation-respiration switch protein FrsA (DUF1100 family)
MRLLYKIGIGTGIAAVAAALLFGIIVSLYLIRSVVIRPQEGWPDPALNKTGSRAPFLDEISRDKSWFLSQKPEDVYISSYDGLKLHALFLSADTAVSPKGTVIMMHGFHSNSLFEFAGIYNYFHQEGYNVLLCDMRSHGKSEGKYLAFGIKERYDCRSWAEYVSTRFPDRNVWIMGVSMGASTVLMASGLTMPLNVKGFIADCGYTAPAAILKVSLVRDYHLPAWLILPIADIFMRIRAGFSIYGYSTLTAMKTDTLPILFIHGDKDSYVPFEMSEENYKACKAPKQFLRTHADHAANFLTEPEAYKQALKTFMQ